MRARALRHAGVRGVAVRKALDDGAHARADPIPDCRLPGLHDIDTAPVAIRFHHDQASGHGRKTLAGRQPEVVRYPPARKPPPPLATGCSPARLTPRESNIHETDVTLYLDGVFTDYPGLRIKGKRKVSVAFERDAEGKPYLEINLASQLVARTTTRKGAAGEEEQQDQDQDEGPVETEE